MYCKKTFKLALTQKELLQFSARKNFALKYESYSHALLGQISFREGSIVNNCFATISIQLCKEILNFKFLFRRFLLIACRALLECVDWWLTFTVLKSLMFSAVNAWVLRGHCDRLRNILTLSFAINFGHVWHFSGYPQTVLLFLEHFQALIVDNYGILTLF